MTAEIPNKKSNPYYQAQAILSRRNHSEHEVRTKLHRKGFTAPIIDEVVEWLKKQRLLDDHQFAQLYVTSILNSKAVGPRYIVAKLRSRHIHPSLIATVVSELYSPTQVRVKARLAAQRWRQQQPPAKQTPDRLVRFLIGRGFSYQDLEGIVTDSQDQVA